MVGSRSTSRTGEELIKRGRRASSEAGVQDSIYCTIRTMLLRACCGVCSLHRHVSQRVADGRSVLAVHGIGAHPDRTWTSGDVNWLRDEHMLPQAIPNARILRFGYESQWLGKDAIQQRLSLVADQMLRGLMESRKVSNGCLEILWPSG